MKSTSYQLRFVPAMALFLSLIPAFNALAQEQNATEGRERSRPPRTVKSIVMGRHYAAHQ